jgi:acyl-CoA reductase-like NAD-dependent aldehyde dehydrogenase
MATVEQIPQTHNGVAHADEEIIVENPGTGAQIGTVPDLDAAAVAELAKRGRAAQVGWDAYGFEGRSRVLKRMQKWLMDNADRVTETIVSETGKTYEDARLSEITYGGGAFGFWAKNAEKYLEDEHVKSAAVAVKGKKLILRHRPLGLIGVIGPWNFPLINSFGDCIPALAAGNSVILKPSEVTPLTSLLLAEGLRESGLPADVLQIATGRGETGAALIEQVDMIMFTGSTRTGRKVAETAARRLIPASLELGGKDPMVVLRDADLERAANTAVWGSMMNAGQTCISIERAYVEAPVYDEFVAKVSEKVRELRQGRSGAPGSVDVGAVTFPPQLGIIEEHVEDALAKGARVLVGGKRGEEGAGDFFQPTVLVDVDHSMKCMTEETFGPTLPIMKVADEDEAVRMANDSIYGLAGSVFGRDTAHAEEVARRLDTGAVCVNDAIVNYFALELPMGGAKASGLGSRHGAGGIRKFCSQQAVLVTPRVLARKKDLTMFPYKAGTSKLLAGAFKFLYGRGNRD